MKTWILRTGALAGACLMVATLSSGCSSAYYASSARYASDDLYVLHDRTQIARKQQAEAEARKAAAEARQAEWEARLAEAGAQAAENGYYKYSTNPYNDVLADDYESAYARRLRGFQSLTYNMPSSYINARYSGAFDYVSAYDPAFYNVIVMGDEVWVEPKYITSMFGTWGRPVVLLDPWYYGWASPSFSLSVGSWGWGFGWNSWWNPWWNPWYSSWYSPWWGSWYSSWYNPWWGPGWGWPHHPHWGPGWGPGWGGGHHYPNRPGIVHRPSRPYRSQLFGSGSSTTVNRATNGNRTWRSGVYQGGSGNTSRGSISRGNDRTGTFDWIRGNSSSDRTGNRRTPSNRSFNNSYNSYRSGSFNSGGFSGGGGGFSSGGGRSGGSTGSSSRGR